MNTGDTVYTRFNDKWEKYIIYYYTNDFQIISLQDPITLIINRITHISNIYTKEQYLDYQLDMILP